MLLTNDTAFDGMGDASKIFVNYEKLSSILNPGNSVLLDDGLIMMEVKEIGADGVTCALSSCPSLDLSLSLSLFLTLSLPAHLLTRGRSVGPQAWCRTRTRSVRAAFSPFSIENECLSLVRANFRLKTVALWNECR